MKISSIALHRFRSAVDLILDLNAPRVLLSGRNGVGKTQVKEALRFALLGHCTGTDARGSGWESLIPHAVPNEGLAVSLQADVLGAVTRRYIGSSRSLSVEGVTGESSIQQAGVFAKLQTAPAYLESCLETSFFLGLHHSAAKALVLELLDVRIPVGEERLTLEQVDSRYKAAFEERKSAKVRLRSHAVPPKPMDEGTPMPALEAIDAQLTRLRTELQELSRSAGNTAGRRAVLEQRLRQAETLDIVPGEPDSAEIARLEAMLAVPVADPAIPLTPHWGSDAEVKARIEALKAHRPRKGCVLDPDVPCETPIRKFKSQVQLLTAMNPDVPQDAPPAPQIDRRSVERQLNDLYALQERIIVLTGRNEAKATEAEALRMELSSLKDETEGSAAIDGLQARIRKGELLRARAAEYWQAVGRYEQAVALHKGLEEAVARLEETCELLGPNGVRVDALRSAIGSFEAKVNAFTGLFGWTLAFVLEPWGVLVNDRPVETYSKSEGFRIGIALQLAIAELSGLSFAVVDELDMLDVENRKLASKMILEAPVGQVILLATREPEQPLPQSNEKLLAYRFGMEDGRTMLLEAPNMVAVA